MAGTKTVDQIDAELAELEPKLSKLASLPDSFEIGPNKASGIGNAYWRLKGRIEELCRQREALIDNDGCPLPTRGVV